jgi:hypothetical protein
VDIVYKIPVAGYRWCRGCNVAADVAVDELLGTVTVSCQRCGHEPDCVASSQIVRTCKKSLRASATKRHWKPRMISPEPSSAWPPRNARLGEPH